MLCPPPRTVRGSSVAAASHPGRPWETVIIDSRVYLLPMKDLLTVLLDIEKRAWGAADTRDVEFYWDYLAPEALVVTPFAVLDRDGIIRDLTENPNELPAYTITDPKVVPLGEESAVLVYTVSLGGQILYVSTVYAWSDGRWRAAFHQRTPASPVATPPD